MRLACAMQASCCPGSAVQLFCWKFLSKDMNMCALYAVIQNRLLALNKHFIHAAAYELSTNIHINVHVDVLTIPKKISWPLGVSVRCGS